MPASPVITNITLIKHITANKMDVTAPNNARYSRLHTLPRLFILQENVDDNDGAEEPEVHKRENA
jgi:hypothetical protein